MGPFSDSHRGRVRKPWDQIHLIFMKCLRHWKVWEVSHGNRSSSSSIQIFFGSFRSASFERAMNICCLLHGNQPIKVPIPIDLQLVRLCPGNRGDWSHLTVHVDVRKTWWNIQGKLLRNILELSSAIYFGEGQTVWKGREWRTQDMDSMDSNVMCIWLGEPIIFHGMISLHSFLRLWSRSCGKATITVIPSKRP